MLKLHVCCGCYPLEEPRRSIKHIFKNVDLHLITAKAHVQLSLKSRGAYRQYKNVTRASA